MSREGSQVIHFNYEHAHTANSLLKCILVYVILCCFWFCVFCANWQMYSHALSSHLFCYSQLKTLFIV